MTQTEQEIISTAWQLLKEKPFTKITIAEIVKRCHVNRNTFYYHFHGMEDLVERSGREWVDRLIREHTETGRPFESLFYVISQCEENRAAIRNVYNSVPREIFLEILDVAALYLVGEYIRKKTSGLDQRPEDRDIMIRFYKSALVGIFLDWLKDDMGYDLTAVVKRIVEILRDADLQAFFTLYSGEAPEGSR